MSLSLIRIARTLPTNGPTKFPRYWNRPIEIEHVLGPALQRWKTFGSHLFRNGPDVRQFPINRTPEELSKRHRRTRTHLELAFADKP
jgi:hypothetical protein